jgi:hypothetical protein
MNDKEKDGRFEKFAGEALVRVGLSRCSGD